MRMFRIPSIFGPHIFGSGHSLADTILVISFRSDFPPICPNNRYRLRRFRREGVLRRYRRNKNLNYAVRRHQFTSQQPRRYKDNKIKLRRKGINPLKFFFFFSKVDSKTSVKRILCTVRPKTLSSPFWN